MELFLFCSVKTDIVRFTRNQMNKKETINMKFRFTALVMALVLSISMLTACGSKDDGQSNANVDLKAFVTALAEDHGENFAANTDVVEAGMHNDMYPGIADIETKQLVIFQPMMGAVVCEIALAEVANADDVEAVKAIFQSRIDAQVAGGAWYPESIEGWKNNSRIVTNGNYVMMIAWQYADDAVTAFNELF